MYIGFGQNKGFARFLERVLVIDPQPASVRLLIDLLKDLGAKTVSVEQTTSRALQAARVDNPQMIFSEYAGPDLDGLELTGLLRRSDLACRQVPVIMVTSEATTQSILGARDVGVHEFLRKPYTIRELVRRIEAVTVRPRDWIEGVRYVGPDRRRFNSGDYKGPRKRQADTAVDSDAARMKRALRILRDAVGAMESDPRQALRAMQAQALDLTQAAMTTGDSSLATAVAGLHHVLTECAYGGNLNRPKIEQACLTLWPYLPADTHKAA